MGCSRQHVTLAATVNARQYARAYPKFTSYFLSFLCRVSTKVVGDFTGSPLFRLPNMLSGTYYTFNLAMTQVSVLVCAHV